MERRYQLTDSCSPPISPGVFIIHGVAPGFRRANDGRNEVLKVQ